MKEINVVKELRQQLKLFCKNTIYIKKIAIGEFNESGIPDLIGILNGRGFGIEVKIANSWPLSLMAAVIAEKKFTFDQLTNLTAIAKAGGIGCGFIAIQNEGVILPVDYLINSRYPITKKMITLFMQLHPELKILRKSGRWQVNKIADYFINFRSQL